MSPRIAFLVALVSFVSWIETGARSFNDVFKREDNLIDPSSEMDPRVIGGRAAEVNEFPWMVSLHYRGSFICSSFLITPNMLMTAAHCVVFREEAEPPRMYKGYVGTVNRDGPQTEIRFREIIAHENYGSGTEYDIALMRLRTPVQLNDGVQTVCLPSKGTKFENTIAQAMGWGVYEKGGREPSKTLQTVAEKVPSNAECRETYRKLGIPVTQRHVCAGGDDTGICFGDSGGPLVDLNRTRPLAVGVASFVSYRGCATSKIPAVYTATASYLDWVRVNMGKAASELCIM